MEEIENTDNSSLDSLFNSNSKFTLDEKINCKMNERNESKVVLKLISNLLTDICETNKSPSDEKISLLKPFILKKIPSISIINYPILEICSLLILCLVDYIERLFKYSKHSEEIMIIVLIYIDIIRSKHKINLNYYNIHKIIFASFIVTIKFHEDDYYSLNYYSKLGGIPKKEIINLEYEFLKLMNFNLFIKDELFEKYKGYLKSLEREDDDDFDIYDDDS